MALSFHPTTTTAAPLSFRHHLGLGADLDDMSFLQDVHPDVTDALLGFVCDPLNPAVDAGIDGFLNPVADDDDGDDAYLPHCAKRPRASCGDDALLDFTAVKDVCLGEPWINGGGGQQVPALPEFLTEFVLPLPPPPPEQQQQPMPPTFVRGEDANKAEGNGCQQSVQSAAARERRNRISEKTAELSRLIPSGHKLNTAEMLQEAGRHVKLLQAQVGVLALMHTIEDKVPSMAVEQMHALLVRGSVQERLAAQGRCLVPRKLIDDMAEDNAIKSNALVNRDLTRFMESLEQ